MDSLKRKDTEGFSRPIWIGGGGGAPSTKIGGGGGCRESPEKCVCIGFRPGDKVRIKQEAWERVFPDKPNPGVCTICYMSSNMESLVLLGHRMGNYWWKEKDLVLCEE